MQNPIIYITKCSKNSVKKRIKNAQLFQRIREIIKYTEDTRYENQRLIPGKRLKKKVADRDVSGW